VKPARDAFTRAELRVVERNRSPQRVQRWLNSLPYNRELAGETLRAFRGVVRTGTAHCLEAALSAATILDQHGFEPLLLDLESQDQLDHVLFLFRGSDGRWGTVGRSRDPGLHGRRPVFATLRALVDSYFDPFVDLSGRIIGYGVCHLEDLGGYDWRLSSRNVWKVQRHLVDMPHRSFHGSERRYHLWHQRYIAYRRRFPDRKPLYYPVRRSWMPGYPS